MRSSAISLAAALSLLLAATTSTGAPGQYYKEPAGETIAAQVVTVPFPFQAGTKILAAGDYTVEQPSRELLVFTSVKGVSCDVPVMTRIAKPETPLTEGRVVFDKFGDTYYISELWVPGADGFYLGGMREPHTHRAVKTTKKK